MVAASLAASLAIAASRVNLSLLSFSYDHSM